MKARDIIVEPTDGVGVERHVCYKHKYLGRVLVYGEIFNVIFQPRYYRATLLYPLVKRVTSETPQSKHISFKAKLVSVY